MVTLITGASTGIGAEFARQFAARGHGLVVVARSADKLNALAAQLRAAHRVDVTVMAMDLSLPGAAGELWQRTNRLGLEVSVLVNNAGSGTHGDVADADPQRLEEEIELNCRTLVGVTARYLPHMRARGAGTIINVASTAAFQPLPKMAVYGATKDFVLSFSEALWAEEHKHGVRVLAVCPARTGRWCCLADVCLCAGYAVLQGSGRRRGRCDATFRVLGPHTHSAAGRRQHDA